jgi:hypothetical protein
VPNTEGQKVWFEKCNCTPVVAHGYFHHFRKGRCPWPTESVEAAECMLKGLARENHLSTEEVEGIRKQVRAAGLQEAMSEEELVMLLEFSDLAVLAVIMS